jgi:hypothetical protein
MSIKVLSLDLILPVLLTWQMFAFQLCSVILRCIIELSFSQCLTHFCLVVLTFRPSKMNHFSKRTDAFRSRSARTSRWTLPSLYLERVLSVKKIPSSFEWYRCFLSFFARSCYSSLMVSESKQERKLVHARPRREYDDA